uniref:Uncharacterized protein n=1 Tax=Cucumis melo TaxID=3656 RepID=A0A9I9EDK2_CUCME
MTALLLNSCTRVPCGTFFLLLLRFLSDLLPFIFFIIPYLLQTCKDFSTLFRGVFPSFFYTLQLFSHRYATSTPLSGVRWKRVKQIVNWSEIKEKVRIKMHRENKLRRKESNMK